MASSAHQQNQDGGSRPRSGTAGSTSQQPQSAPRQRPSHIRSRSYLSNFSPTDTKPRNASTMPTEASPPMHKPAPNETHILRQRGSDSHLNPRTSRLHFHGHKSRFSQDTTQIGKDGSLAPPRSHLHMLTRTHSHRHTKSDIPVRWNNSDDPERNQSQPQLAANDPTFLHPAVTAAKGNMLTRISTNLSGKNVGAPPHKPRHQYSASDFHKGRLPAGPSNLSVAGSRPDIRRRATSDPRAPLQQTMRDGMAARYGVAGYIDGAIPIKQAPRRPLTEIEMLLLRAEKTRKEEESSVTEADVQKLVTRLAESRVDLQEQLSSNQRTSASLMRRLDDAHDMLISTASAMIDTISSFQNLCQQSEALIGNFDHRTAELDQSTRKTLEGHRKALFEQRGEKIGVLEERGRKASERAEEMSRRLENCRTIVRNYSDREHTKRRAWRGVMVGTISGVFVIMLGFLLGFGLWWYKNYGGEIRYEGIHDVIAGAIDQGGIYSVRGPLNHMVQQQLRGHKEEEARRQVNVLEKVPMEVKSVLDDIASRHDSAYHSERVGLEEKMKYIRPVATGDIDDDRHLRKLFEKLEL